MNEIEQVTLDIVRSSSSLLTIVKYRNPPRRVAAGCCQSPLLGEVTRSTPSNVVFAEGKDESSEALRRMNNGDSVKEKATEDEDEICSKLMEIKPPTCKGVATH